ncbi:ArsR/SmtB family transcription factor [Streptomyces rubiginosohelvolus]|uniref:ArsR/SmtB family transcription factor n=1 Tax=Streptomyces rubiginosohelvolus TaxID=67362 RepID=UPI0033C5034B
MSHPQRLRVIAELADGRVYVSELARRLDMSRPLLYLHLERLEKAGLVVGTLELGEDGTSLKYFELGLFNLHLNVDTIREAVQDDDATAVAGAKRGPQLTDRRNLADLDGLDSVDE